MDLLTWICDFCKSCFRALFGGSTPLHSTDTIKHVIVLMLENHSFDQMLGCFKSVYTGLDGVDPAKPGCNKDSTGHEYFQHVSSDPTVDPDPKHELDHILNSLKDGNSGFVSEYEKEYPQTTPAQRQRIMDYFGMDDLPALHALAKHFTICDHWYSSVPGPTWTNRFFAYSGTSKGIVDMPTSVGQTELYLHYDQVTIFDRLNEAKIPWRVYFGDVPNSLVLRHQQRPENVLHYRWMHTFVEDAQKSANDFPAFCLIEPNYQRGEQNDDHPPHSTMRAQRLIAHVYNTLVKNEDLWNSTLLVILYDENGGFYDHVPPPEAVPPDHFQDKYAFNSLGVRVPALLISPWIEKGVLSTPLDHTSLLKFLIDKWKLGPLTERVTNAKSFAEVIRTSGQPRTDTPESVPTPPLMMEAGPLGSRDEMAAVPMNENQKALLVFSEYLEQQSPAPPGRMAIEAAPFDEGLPRASQVAKRRVERFLNQEKAKALGGST